MLLPLSLDFIERPFEDYQRKRIYSLLIPTGLLTLMVWSWSLSRKKLLCSCCFCVAEYVAVIWDDVIIAKCCEQLRSDTSLLASNM